MLFRSVSSFPAAASASASANSIEVFLSLVVDSVFFLFGSALHAVVKSIPRRTIAVEKNDEVAIQVSKNGGNKSFSTIPLSTD